MLVRVRVFVPAQLFSPPFRPLITPLPVPSPFPSIPSHPSPARWVVRSNQGDVPPSTEEPACLQRQLLRISRMRLRRRQALQRLLCPTPLPPRCCRSVNEVRCISHLLPSLRAPPRTREGGFHRRAVPPECSWWACFIQACAGTGKHRPAPIQPFIYIYIKHEHKHKHTRHKDTLRLLFVQACFLYISHRLLISWHHVRNTGSIS